MSVFEGSVMQLSALSSVCAVCVFITVVPITKLIERGGGGNGDRHVL